MPAPVCGRLRAIRPWNGVPRSDLSTFPWRVGAVLPLVACERMSTGHLMLAWAAASAAVPDHQISARNTMVTAVTRAGRHCSVTSAGRLIAAFAASPKVPQATNKTIERSCRTMGILPARRAKGGHEITAS